MTLRYSHLSPDHKRAAVEKLSSQMDTDQEFEKLLESSDLSSTYQQTN